jgi:streptogramin lyase
VTRRVLKAALCIVAVAALAQGAWAGTPGNVTNYSLSAGSSPRGITQGPDFAFWITLSGSNKIARMTTAGGVTTFNVPTPGAGLDQIAVGPDGNLWFTETGASKVGRITTAGAITEFATPTANANPEAITASPTDGNVWFTEGAGANQVGRIDPTGAITEFPLPGGTARDITSGPDGNLWYTNFTANKVGKLVPATAVATEFFAPGNPTNITTADANSLWYTQGSGNAIARIATTGATPTHTALPQTQANSTNAITRGGDGNGWFTEGTAGRVGFITPNNQVTVFDLTGVTLLGAIVPGPDGAIWMVDTNNNRISRVDTSASSAAIPPPPPPPELGKSMAATPVSGTVLVRLPGAAKFETLTAAQSLPVKTVVDATKGVLRLTATSGALPYSANFNQGQFQIAQLAKTGSTADLKLSGGSFKHCPAGLRSARSRASKGVKSVRRLWGEGTGQFRTVGRFSSATVRGTKWLTDDQCTGTLTRVTQGTVSVRDFVKRKTVVVRAGGSYLAKARG